MEAIKRDFLKRKEQVLKFVYDSAFFTETRK
jgi:hypothetical protein